MYSTFLAVRLRVEQAPIRARLTLSKQSKNRIDEFNSMSTTRPSVAGLVFAGLLVSMAGGSLAPAQGYPSSQSGAPTSANSGAPSGPAAATGVPSTASGANTQSGAPGLPTPVPAGPTSSSFQGSVPQGQSTGQTIGLSLDDAIQRGLRANL